MFVGTINRFMFWTDFGKTAMIERAFLDGSDRRVIHDTDLLQPVGITVDYDSRRIYWSDVELDRLEYSSFDGSGRSVVETEASGLFHPFTLTVANELLFWTDWETDSVYTTHKEHGANGMSGYFATVARFTSNPYGIEAVLESRQQPGKISISESFFVSYNHYMLHLGNNSCHGSNCSHLCLLTATNEQGFTCACPEGYGLETDGFTCKGDQLSLEHNGYV